MRVIVFKDSVHAFIVREVLVEWSKNQGYLVTCKLQKGCIIGWYG